MTSPRLLLMAALAAASPLGAQQPGAAPLNLDNVRKAVVTVHALDADGETMASGTGFFVFYTGPGGLVVTAAHVLAGASACSIELNDGETRRCSVSASDTAKDVLMLFVPGTAPGLLKWGWSDAAHDGDEISVVSNPLGQLPGTLSKGIISASRVVNGTKLLQISAPISHGSSGAPVLNSQGLVIGVVRSTIERGQALNFATATDVVRNLQMDPAATAEAKSVLRIASAAAVEAAAPSAPTASGPRSISVGQTMNGELTSGDQLYSDTTYYQLWHLTTTTGQGVTIDLSSSDFDPVLIVRGAADSSLVNDDGGPGCASRVAFTAPGSGPFTILVNTTSTPHRQTGKFTLSITSGRKPVDPPNTRDCEPAASAAGGTAHPIAVGQTVNGQLTDSDELYSDTTYYQRWQLTTRSGQDVTVDLSSPDFDPVLIVRGVADSSLINDDGGPGCASRVVFTAPGTGPYTILANTTSDPHRQTGRFTLSISAGRKPVDPRGASSDCHPDTREENMREIPPIRPRGR